MTNWREKQLRCDHCHGYGYVVSAARHDDGSGRPAWAARCMHCQPHTLADMEQAAAQEDWERARKRRTDA